MKTFILNRLKFVKNNSLSKKYKPDKKCQKCLTKFPGQPPIPENIKHSKHLDFVLWRYNVDYPVLIDEDLI